MDKSETYIKMSNCPEIQRQAPDDLACEIIVPCYPCSEGSPGLSFLEARDKYTWLPRQDRLQEMANRPSLPWMLRECSDFAFDHDVRFGPELTFDSMEQIWLAFVMKEKYNKVWNGSEWTIEGS